jgi:hypothetical protein
LFYLVVVQYIKDNNNPFFLQIFSRIFISNSRYYQNLKNRHRPYEIAVFENLQGTETTLSDQKPA